MIPIHLSPFSPFISQVTGMRVLNVGCNLIVSVAYFRFICETVRCVHDDYHLLFSNFSGFKWYLYGLQRTMSSERVSDLRLQRTMSFDRASQLCTYFSKASL